jgi:alkylhydroperoxidase/carboxymuconolactone decarboxylase family protein YurZ
MQVPTPDQVEKMMIEKMGELPVSLKSAKAIDPRFLIEQAMSSKFSVQDEKNPFDPKTSMMIALSTSIALGSQECIMEQTKMLKKMGITKEELAYLVKIVKHSQSSIVMGNAKTAFDTFES